MDISDVVIGDGVDMGYVEEFDVLLVFVSVVKEGCYQEMFVGVENG
ncbi:hypothetical protein [Bacillus mycoides]|nr:hypothetical protein [Bacillus mycoides]